MQGLPPGAIWSQVEISVGVISACLPVYRPLFTRRAKAPQNTYSDQPSKPSKHSQSIPLSDRSGGFRSWANVTTVKGPSDDIEERPFVKLEDPQTIHRGVSFSVATERDPS